ncbi:MAG: 5-demethoxyubiquinol-8 5-hydroxylase UbiM [Zavarzinia sp.]|nr:5-demethoxyubiquinol-8 5-hydroxylase UbiM [Zavarzinia sp.]
MDADIAIVGAGPAGLSFARALAGSGLSVTLIEQQPRAALADPAFDGREIALTHASRRIMENLGLWSLIDAADISPLRDARVMDGPSLFAMQIKAAAAGHDALGYLVPNHLIRKAAFSSLMDAGEARLIAETRVTGIERDAQGVRIALSSGETISARLIVCADSRWSETRRMLGIGAATRDFGRSMMVCRMEHEVDHEHVAWEWFGYGQTLAMLPLNGLRASAVLTLPQGQMQAVMALAPDDFNTEMTRRFDGRLGAMKLASTRHVYPLVGVFADRFAGPRCALVGDAAVGMHPVTAHGFNFGLQSQERLAGRLIQAVRIGRDIADPGLLADYDRAHRTATFPLYQATNLIASLYTDERPPARLLRKAALHFANRMVPVKKAIAAHLTQAV